MPNKVSKEIIDFLGLIDHEYAECRSQNVSRMSVRWGKWSRQMNLVIKERIQNKHPDANLYKYLFMYWVNRSQLLEEYYKSKWRQSKKRRLQREGQNLRKVILSGDAPNIQLDTDADLMEFLLRGKTKKERG